MKNNAQKYGTRGRVFPVFKKLKKSVDKRGKNDI